MSEIKNYTDESNFKFCDSNFTIIESQNCNGCYFNTRDECCAKQGIVDGLIPSCSSTHRKDGLDVSFVIANTGKTYPSFKFFVDTDILKDGVISQSIGSMLDDRIEEAGRWTVNTQDQQIKDALIKLGWTPPGFTNDEKKKIKRALYLARRGTAWGYTYRENEFLKICVDLFGSIPETWKDAGD